MTTPIGTRTIRRGVPADLDLVTGVLAAAFQTGDLAGWLVPDPVERVRIYPGYFTLLADHALSYGLVDVADGGVALWYDHSRTAPTEIAEYDARLAAAVGSRLARFQALDQAMHARHPTGRAHHYLAFLAVHPHRQHQGLGGQLLDHHHSVLDIARLPAYLEATGTRNRRLYQRHGYHLRNPYQISADGPPLFPMWRPPNTGLPNPQQTSP